MNGKGQASPDQATPLRYAAVTAIRDELPLVSQLRGCLRRQTLRPIVWQIVDTGSTDGSVESVEDWIRAEPWIRLTKLRASARSRGGLIAGAIEAGVAELEEAPDVLVVVDADVSFESDYFERLLRGFERDPQLGIASGSRYEQIRARWRRRHVTGTSVEAQCRAYRWSCLQEVLPFEKHMGWDGVDEVKANLRGWRTSVFHELSFRHHRPIGGRERSRFAAWRREGEAAHFMGYRPYYAILRSLYHATTDASAVGLAAGFLAASARRLPKVADPEVRGYVRRQQSPLRLPARAAEALGVRAARRRRRGVDVLLVADPGGHLFELAGLRDVWSRFSRAWVTVGAADVAFLDGEEVYFGYGPTTRSIPNLIRNTVVACRLVPRLRPAVVLTTGAALSVPFAWIGRLFGARVVYVECSGRVGISLSCRLIAPIANRLYVQWPESTSLLRRARYAGSIFFSFR